MEIQKINISEQDRRLVSEFMEEEYPIEIDFNWLMEVVEKIGDTYIGGMQLATSISGSKGLYSFVVFGTHIYADDINPNMAVWTGVVKFIKWYNNETL